MVLFCLIISNYQRGNNYQRTVALNCEEQTKYAVAIKEIIKKRTVVSCGQGGVGVPGSSHRALATGTRADVSLAFLCCRDGTNCGLNGASVWLEDGIKAVCCNLAGCRGSFRPPASTPDAPTLYCHTKHSSFYTWNPINKENNFPVNPNQQ